MRKSILFIIMILSMLLAACSGGDSTPVAVPTTVPIEAQSVEPTISLEVEETEAPEASVMVNGIALVDTTWEWAVFSDPTQQFDIEDPANFTVNFQEDGTLAVKADCNIAGGIYTIDGNSLTIEIGPMTMAACSPESRGDDFVNYLSYAAIYFFEDGDLFIDLMADGGTMQFAPFDEESATGEFPADLSAQLDTYLQSQVFTEGGYPESAAPGLVLLVDTPEGRYLNAAGVSSLEDGTPMLVDDRLEIGSNTKSFTIVVLMQLQEEGLLTFDDLLGDWLPDLASQIPYGDQITLRQLANHTSGIWDYGDPLIGEAAENPDKLEGGYMPEELVQYTIDNGTPDFDPGEGGQWNYSNTGYILLGMVAEAVSGRSLNELYQERIFEPLSLESAVLISGVPQEGEITSQGYWWREDDGTRLNTTNWNVSQGWAAGGIAMTAEDLARYAIALTSGELFQQAGSLEQMVAFNQDALFAGGYPYGLGLMDLGEGYIGHEGQTAGFQSLWYANPDEGITVVGLTNSAAYPAYLFLNVRNILDGTGPMPFTAVTLIPIAEEEPGFTMSKWVWTQRVELSGSSTTEIDPVTEISFSKDGNVHVKGEGCGVAFGTYTTPAPYEINLNLDSTDAVTCTEDEPLVELLTLLESVESWGFENGALVIILSDGTALNFRAFE